MPGMSFRLRCGAVCLALCATAFSQNDASSERLRAITRAAGTIFRGTVISVRRVALSHDRQLDTIEVCFHVDEALRGTRAGTSLCIREWSGLWTSSDRYRVGEPLVLFLYPPSRLGLTSPVGGDQGRFPIDGSGGIVFPSPLVPQPASVERPVPSPVNSHTPNHPPSPRLSPREFRRLVNRAAE